MSHDIPYEFRQNSDFLYLTGMEEPEAIAVFRNANGSQSFTLFVQPRDAGRCVIIAAIGILILEF